MNMGFGGFLLPYENLIVSIPTGELERHFKGYGGHWIRVMSSLNFGNLPYFANATPITSKRKSAKLVFPFTHAHPKIV